MRSVAAGFIFGLFLTVVPLYAQQSISPSYKLTWDQPASSLAEANAMRHLIYIDGSNTGVAVTGKTCTGTSSPFKCSINNPATSIGSHTVQITAEISLGNGNYSAASPKSVLCNFIVIGVPSTPVNLLFVP